MTDSNDCVRRAWTAGAVTGAVTFILFWILFAGFLVSLLVGALLGAASGLALSYVRCGHLFEGPSGDIHGSALRPANSSAANPAGGSQTRGSTDPEGSAGPVAAPAAAAPVGAADEPAPGSAAPMAAPLPDVSPPDEVSQDPGHDRLDAPRDEHGADAFPPEDTRR